MNDGDLFDGKELFIELRFWSEYVPGREDKVGRERMEVFVVSAASGRRLGEKKRAVKLL